jgi:tellurite resistance protein TerC
MTNLASLSLFTLLVLCLVAIELRVARRPRHFTFREAALAAVIWIALALVFDAGVYFWRGPQPALEFLTGYILELSLSLDNVFVFALTFTYAAVPPEDQHRVLFWGILGALVMRSVFIVTGVEFVGHFRWTLALLGIFLVVSGFSFLRKKEKTIHPERNPLLKLARRMFPVTETYEGASFFVRRHGHLFATPLFLVLVMVETTDVLLAVDSIPAVLGVTSDSFIVFTSNILAVLGLRALYFVVARALLKFRYLRVGLSLVLVFMGTKMAGAGFIHVPTWASLSVICAIVAVTILFSLAKGPAESK